MESCRAPSQHRQQRRSEMCVRARLPGNARNAGLLNSFQLGKATGSEVCGESAGQKTLASVARSVFASQNRKNGGARAVFGC